MSWAYYSAEVIPQATISSNQKLSFGRSIAYSVDYARRLSSGNTALLLEFPVAAAPSHRVGERPNQRHHEPRNVICDAFVRVRFASHAPASPWLSGGFEYG